MDNMPHGMECLKWTNVCVRYHMAASLFNPALDLFAVQISDGVNKKPHTILPPPHHTLLEWVIALVSHLPMAIGYRRFWPPGAREHRSRFSANCMTLYYVKTASGEANICVRVATNRKRSVSRRRDLFHTICQHVVKERRHAEVVDG